MRTAFLAEADQPVRRTSPLAVERVTDTLELLARKHLGATLSDASRQLNVPKASLLDILRGLGSRRYVRKDESGRYHLDAGAFGFARSALASHAVLDVAHPVLDRLVRESSETALIARLDETELVSVYVDKVESESPIRYTVPLGLRRELHATSAGKVLLAHFSPEALEAYLEKKALEKFTRRTIVEPEALRRELKRVRSDGLAFTQDERTDGASGIAAPVTDLDGYVVASLTVAGATTRMMAGRARLKQLVRNSAAQISALLADELRRR